MLPRTRGFEGMGGKTGKYVRCTLVEWIASVYLEAVRKYIYVPVIYSA